MRRIEVLRLEYFAVILFPLSKFESAFPDAGPVDEVVINTGVLRGGTDDFGLDENQQFLPLNIVHGAAENAAKRLKIEEEWKA